MIYSINISPLLINIRLNFESDHKPAYKIFIDMDILTIIGGNAYEYREKRFGNC
jgi:hypothetical protein